MAVSAFRPPLVVIAINFALMSSACASHASSAPRQQWPKLSVSKSNRHCTSTALRYDLLLSATLAADPMSGSAKDSMPVLDRAISEIERCDSQYRHPLYKVILANLYSAGALEQEAEQTDNHPAHLGAIDTYLQPAEQYYSEATSYVTPPQIRPFLDRASKNIADASRIYRLEEQRKEAETY